MCKVAVGLYWAPNEVLVLYVYIHNLFRREYEGDGKKIINILWLFLRF
jgi:hypothetical protein